MKRKSAGVWGGIAVLVVGAIFFFYSLKYPYSSEIGPGPGFFPLWLSGFIVVLGALYLFQSWKGDDSSEKMPSREGMKNILFILISMSLYVLLLPIIGFNICSAVFLFALLFKAYGWLLNLAISVGSAAFLYVLFSIFLGVQLPVNVLGF